MLQTAAASWRRCLAQQQPVVAVAARLGSSSLISSALKPSSSSRRLLSSSIPTSTTFRAALSTLPTAAAPSSPSSSSDRAPSSSKPKPKLDFTSIKSSSSSPRSGSSLGGGSSRSPGGGGSSNRRGGGGGGRSSPSGKPSQSGRRGGGSGAGGGRMLARKPRKSVHVVLPNNDLGDINMKTLANVSKLGFRTLLYHLVKLGGSERAVERIDSKVLDKIRAKRVNHKGALNTLADTIDIPLDTAELLLLELGCTVERAKREQKDRVRSVATDKTPKRAPIVVVMGHVDHGKTTLLDSLRNTNVVAKEHGGITQAIAGFKINFSKDLSVCFMDTPGHEAFSLMRRSGTAVTDLAVIVIACTEGVMPQTIESVKYARDAKLPIVFALTKSDLMPEFDENALIDQLNLHSLYDADADIFVPVVATKKQGLDELMDAIQLAVETDPLRSRSVKAAPGEAVVLESRVDKSLGMVADVVVRWGTFKVGDAVVCGDQFGKIRRMLNSDGEVIKSAEASTPVRLCGPFERCPLPGLDVLAVKDDKTAKMVVEHRLDVARQQQQREARVRQLLGTSSSASSSSPYDKFAPPPKRKTRKEKRVYRKQKEEALEAWNVEEEKRRAKEFRCILKADSEGSLHALQFAMAQLKDKQQIPEGHELIIVRKSVGQLTEQDVDLAKSTNATVLGFNLKMSNQLGKLVKNENVQVLSNTIIYHLVEEYVRKLADIKREEDEEEEAQQDEVEGECQVLQVFQITGKEKRQVAGCRVTTGTLNKARMFVVMRDGQQVSEPRGIESMKILKEDAASVDKGLECGLALKGFAAFQVGDVIQCIRPAPK